MAAQQRPQAESSVQQLIELEVTALLGAEGQGLKVGDSGNETF